MVLTKIPKKIKYVHTKNLIQSLQGFEKGVSNIV